MKGENRPNRNGGTTPAARKFRDSPEGRKWKKDVLERDNRTCRRCGEKNCKLAHHIGSVEDYPELAHEITNGLTLCRECHRLTHIFAEAGAFDLLIIPESEHPVWRF